MSVQLGLLKDMTANFLEKWPSFGILASFAGFSATLLALLHALSIVLGFGGAVFGLLAGFYTWRIKRLHWERISHES